MIRSGTGIIRIVLAAVSAVSAMGNTAAMGLFAYAGLKAFFDGLVDSSRFVNAMLGLGLLMVAAIFALHVAVAFQWYTQGTYLLYAGAAASDVGILLLALVPCILHGAQGMTVSSILVVAIVTTNLSIVVLRWWASKAAKDA